MPLSPTDVAHLLRQGYRLIPTGRRALKVFVHYTGGLVQGYFAPESYTLLGLSLIPL